MILTPLALFFLSFALLIIFLASDEKLSLMIPTFLKNISALLLGLKAIIFRSLLDISVILAICCLLSWVFFVKHPFMGSSFENIFYKVEPSYFSSLGDFIAGLPVLIISFASLILVVRSNGERKKIEAENTFFTLLNANIELTKNLKYSDVTGDVDGVNVIRKFYNIFFEDEFGVNLLDGRKENYDSIISSYERLYDGAICEYLGHYFRNVYHLFLSIDKSEISEIEKLRLSNIFLSNLSNSQLVMLLLNSQSKYGKSMAVLAKKYNAFENLKEFHPKTSVNFFLRMTKNHTDLLSNNKFVGENLNLYDLVK